MGLLDCRDTRISLWQHAEAVHSPGFVLFDAGEYRFGQAALEQSRLRPHDSNSRFWWQLSTQPLKPALGAARHTADLVHAHLRDVHRRAGAPEALTLAVPDAMPREQRSLLLGVAQTCDFAVSGLVSRSVLLASATDTPAGVDRVLHVEAQLNPTVINELHSAAGVLSLARSTPLPACGLLALLERCVSAIASAFIQQTRYDPRRSAASEQTLYNELPSVLAALDARGEASLDIEGHRCRITAATLDAASTGLREELAPTRRGAAQAVLIDPELATLPGMGALRDEAITLAEDALWQAWQQQREQVALAQGDAIHLIDRLKVRAPARGASPQPRTPSAERGTAPAQTAVDAAAAATATHILVGTRALPLRGERIELGSGFALHGAQRQWTLHGAGALINGRPSTPQQALCLGDTLSLGAAGQARLIEVVD